MFKPGKAYEKTRKEYDKRAGAIGSKKKDIERRIEETTAQIKEVEDQKTAAKENLNFDHFKALQETEKGLINDRNTLETFLAAATKIITPEEAKSMRDEIRAEYGALIREYDKKFNELLENFQNIRENFEAVQKLYSGLEGDIKRGSGEKGEDYKNISTMFSPYWNPDTNNAIVRLKTTTDGKKSIMNYKP